MNEDVRPEGADVHAKAQDALELLRQAALALASPAWAATRERLNDVVIEHGQRLKGQREFTGMLSTARMEGPPEAVADMKDAISGLLGYTDTLFVENAERAVMREVTVIHDEILEYTERVRELCDEARSHYAALFDALRKAGVGTDDGDGLPLDQWPPERVAEAISATELLGEGLRALRADAPDKEIREDAHDLAEHFRLGEEKIQEVNRMNGLSGEMATAMGFATDASIVLNGILESLYRADAMKDPE